jgi:hypothetical protein
MSIFNVVHSQRCEIRWRRMMLHHTPPHHTITLTKWTSDMCNSDEFSWLQQRTVCIGREQRSLINFNLRSIRIAPEQVMILNSLQTQQWTPFNKNKDPKSAVQQVFAVETFYKNDDVQGISWPARWPDLSACNLSLWGCLNSSVSDTFGRLTHSRTKIFWRKKCPMTFHVREMKSIMNPSSTVHQNWWKISNGCCF